MPSWSLQQIQIVGGYLDGLQATLPANCGLVCVIGARGSGKSTLVEAIRHALGQAGQLTRSRQDFVQANLGSATITLSAQTGDGISYVVSRRGKEAAVVARNDGHPLSSVDLSRGTFLPLDAFGSQEIESIADESLGPRRRALLDEIRMSELRTIDVAVNTCKRALSENADAIRAAQQQLAEVQERRDELADAREVLESLPAAGASEAEPLGAATRQAQANRREHAMIETACTELRALAREIEQVRVRVEQLGRAITPVEESTNRETLIALRRSHEDLVRESSSSLSAAAGTLLRGADLVYANAETLRARHAEQDAVLAQLRSAATAASAVLQARLDAERNVATLAELERRAQELQVQIDALGAERGELKAKYLLERERASHLREEVASDLRDRTGSRVRIRIHRHGDDLAYRQLLLGGLHGARLRNHDEIIEALLRIRPEELGEIIRRNDFGELQRHTSYSADRATKILDAFRSSLDAFAVEVVEIDDRVAIELNVGSDREPLFRDAAELSRGQKCTALLPLLLGRRDCPLVIDQPEDNLDNRFIYETVVESIRRLKARRQMIFVTHNANIPVLGEADAVFVLQSDGRRGSIAKSGTVDACRTEIIDLLEGGREAFDLRRKRYGRP